jgi:hypothetical protein
MGAKATAVRRLPVVTSEVLSYRWAGEQLPDDERLVHLWINGPADLGN